MRSLILNAVLSAGLWLGLSHGAAQAQDGSTADPARQVHLLQYIAVDYGEAVAAGEIINPEEYAEMEEFAGVVQAELQRLEARPGLEQLQEKALELQQLIAAQADPAEVSAHAEQIRQGLLASYPVVPLPADNPDLAAGAALYQTHCASCHGVNLDGQGPAGAGLEPAPANFTDIERAQQLDVLAYFNTIRYGVEGTGMASYQAMPEQDRWNMSFYLATVATSEAQRQRGSEIWLNRGGGDFTDLAAVIRATPASLGADQQALLAYLRAHPESLVADQDSLLALARNLLDQSLERYLAGDAEAAQRLAVAAYLDGYELSESSLASRDADFSRTLENKMLAFRQLLRQGSDPDQVRAAHAELITGLNQAEALIASDEDTGFWLGFLGALLVLIREGLEAILVVAAVLAFVKRVAGGSTASIHWGWILALVAGFATWWVAVTLIDISGATREITEGGAALVAAVVLFYMGFWLHDKSHAASWQQYLKQHMQGALSSGSRFGLGALAFIAVYREIFETILFLEAIWVHASSDGQLGMVIGGVVSVLALVVLAVLILRFSARLPLSKFFGFSALLMSVLAVVFAGKGVVALQEAGWLPIHSVNFPEISWLGIYPSWQGLGLQLVMVALLVYLMFLRPQAQAPATA